MHHCQSGDRSILWWGAVQGSPLGIGSNKPLQCRRGVYSVEWCSRNLFKQWARILAVLATLILPCSLAWSTLPITLPHFPLYPHSILQAPLLPLVALLLSAVGRRCNGTGLPADTLNSVPAECLLQWRLTALWQSAPVEKNTLRHLISIRLVCYTFWHLNIGENPMACNGIFF